MPTPLKNEKKSDYISRCISQVIKEGKTQEQAAGKCYGLWDEHKKSSDGSVELDNKDEILISSRIPIGSRNLA